MEALKKGHEVLLSAPLKIVSSAQVRDLREHGLEVLAIPELNRVTRRMAQRGMYSRYSKVFNANLDIIFISMGGVADCFWIPDLLNAVRNVSCPIAVLVQANAEGIVQNEEERSVLRNFYKKASTVFFVSSHNHLLAERQLAWKFPECSVVMNPLRTRMDAPLPWEESSDEELRLAVVARLEVADKQQDQLLEALSNEVWKDRNWKLTLYGSGDDKKYLQRLATFYGLGEKVVIGGFIDDFKEIWRHQHWHILPSRREGMPLALIESMACGRPALVTRAGGSAELVEDGISGYICPGMHPEVLRESLERLWDNRFKSEQMGKAAHEKIKKVIDHNWAKNLLDRLLLCAVHGDKLR